MTNIRALDVPLEVVTFDIYRDIHKGIRSELFGVTAAAGNVDPHDDAALDAFEHRLHALVGLLEAHAEHEDRYLTPLLVRDDATLADTITDDHVELDAQLAELVRALADIQQMPDEQRRLAAHRMYLGIASFTSDYLEHQAVEELQVMPALATGYTLEQLLAVNARILASIPPDQMAASLSLLLPAMNIDDRTEMLVGMRATAPRPVFDGVVNIARSVLVPADFRSLCERVGGLHP